MKYFLAFIVALVSGKILPSPSRQTNSIHLISHIDRTKSSNKLNQIKYSNNSLLMSFHSKVPYKFLEVNLVHLGLRHWWHRNLDSNPNRGRGAFVKLGQILDERVPLTLFPFSKEKVQRSSSESLKRIKYPVRDLKFPISLISKLG